MGNRGFHSGSDPGRTNRLDPGKHISQVIEVPFPAAALKAKGLREVSLELTFLPGPYQVDTVNIPVSLGG